MQSGPLEARVCLTNNPLVTPEYHNRSVGASSTGRNKTHCKSMIYVGINVHKILSALTLLIFILASVF